ncbi:MAG: sensor domain-containing diguanylate cyclase, partial [bacterium]
MRSIRTKYTLMTVCAIVAALGIATLIAVVSIRKLGRSDGDQMLSLMCTTGAMNLESYFDSVEQSVEIVSTFVQGNLKEVPLEQLGSQVERSRNLFVDVARNTNGVLTYYFRIDPELSKTEKGFWYVNLDGKGFKEHAVTDISQYDTSDTHSLVWFTIPKATGKGVWLPPYRTENLDVLVISYNVPIYRNETFVGVIGIEIDYETLAHEVENIRLLEDGYAFLIDADSNVIYHPKMDSILIYEHKAIPLPEGLRGDNTHIQYKYEGIDKEAVWRPLRNGMRLYVTVPVSRINSAWQDMIWEILLASLILLVLAVTVTLRFTGHLTKPLLELTKAAKKVSDGNYEFTLDYDKNDEIGILTQTFRQLASSTKEHINSLNQQVFVDALTSVRNRGGHVNYLQKMQDQMDASEEPMEFAIGAFDCDNLKTINDTYGHEKGDIYLKTASRLICRIFQHSPVFRIGGDEFSVILQNSDYQNREELFSLFRKSEEEINEAAESPWEEVKVTFGIAVYDPKRDTSVNDVARRADQIMYENKRIRKEKQNRERSAN